MPNGKTEGKKEIIPRITLRKQKLTKLIADNNGKLIGGKLMRQAGYSPSYANNPGKLKKTKSWEKIMDKYLPEDELAKVHRQKLYATNDYVGKDGKIHKGTDDNDAQLRAVELGYKVRGRLNDKNGGSGDGRTVAEFEAVVIRIRKLLPGSDE